MRIPHYFKRGQKIFAQKDITLNHCFRLVLANDNEAHQLYYIGEMISITDLESGASESEKFKVYSFFKKSLDNTLNITTQLEVIFLKSYGKLEVGYKVFGDNLFIFGFGEDELLILVFCDQSKRSKTIFGAFKAKFMNYCINRANQIWALVYEY